MIFRRWARTWNWQTVAGIAAVALVALLWRAVEIDGWREDAATAAAQAARAESEANGRMIAELREVIAVQALRIAQLEATLRAAGVPVPQPGSPGPAGPPGPRGPRGADGRVSSPSPSRVPSTPATPSPTQRPTPSPPRRCPLPQPLPCLA